MIQKYYIFCFKAVRKVNYILSDILSRFICYFIFKGQNVHFKSYRSRGVPYVSIASNGFFSIGANFRMNNGLTGNPIGRPQKCVFFVNYNALLEIGDNVGISQTAIVCHSKIKIGNECET